MFPRYSKVGGGYGEYFPEDFREPIKTIGMAVTLSIALGLGVSLATEAGTAVQAGLMALGLLAGGITVMAAGRNSGLSIPAVVIAVCFGIGWLAATVIS